MEKLRVGLELGSTESVITAVSEGRGISIISSIAANKAQAAGLVKILKIKEAKNPRKLYMVRPKRPLLKESEAFWEFCKEYISSKMKLSHAPQIKLVLKFYVILRVLSRFFQT